MMGGKIVGKQTPGKVDKLLTPEMTDAAARHRVMRFLESIETAIREANMAVIGRELPHLDRQSFLRMAVRVAELRADYIRLGLQISEQRHPDDAAVEALARSRRAYDEMVAVFEAAQRVVERGYTKLE